MRNLMEDPYAYVAYNSYLCLGLNIESESLSHSVLSIAKKLTTNKNYTDWYFVEEAMFYAFIIQECEMKFNYLSDIADSASSQFGWSSDWHLPDLFGCLFEVLYTIAAERMESANITPTITDSELERWYQPTKKRYLTLLGAHLSCKDEIPTENWSCGLSDRKHPTLAYLGYASDNICKSLDIGDEESDLMDRTSIEVGVLTTHNMRLHLAKEFKKNLQVTNSLLPELRK